MRWKKPSYSTTRIVRRFALWPIFCESRERAWLELVKVEQTFIRQRYSDREEWVNLRFVNDEVETE